MGEKKFKELCFFEMNLYAVQSNREGFPMDKNTNTIPTYPAYPTYAKDTG